MANLPAENRRRYRRHVLNRPATVCFSNTDAEAETLDICREGLALRTGALLDERQQVQVLFDAVGGNKGVIEVTGRVVRTQGDRVAIRFTKLTEASLQRLQSWLLDRRELPQA
jgi:hypothetical protein